MTFVPVEEANRVRARRRALNAQVPSRTVPAAPTCGSTVREVEVLSVRTTVRDELLRFFSGEDPLFGTPRELVDWPAAFAAADRMDHR